MIAPPYDRPPALLPSRLGDRGVLDPSPDPGDGLAPFVAPLLAPLLARLLAGEPLDRDQRAVIVGEVLRLWAVEARLAPRAGADGRVTRR